MEWALKDGEGFDKWSERWGWGSRAPTRRKQKEQRQRVGKGAVYDSFVHSTNIDGMPRVPESRIDIVQS